MEIQWIMLAREFRENPDSTICIDGIFHRINVGKMTDRPSMMLIAKLNPDPIDVGKVKRLLLRIECDGDFVGGLFAQYKVHDEDIWGSRLPYIMLKIESLSLERLGKYTFRLFVENESQNDESIIVRKSEVA